MEKIIKAIALVGNKSVRTVSSVKLLILCLVTIYIGVTPGTLEFWRCTKRHLIPFIKVERLVKYRKSALDAFLDHQTVDARRV